MNNFKFLLFIDDDIASNYYHEYILKDSDIVEETKSFLSSSNALKYFKEAEKYQHKIPEFIFLDLNIPQINGWEFLVEFEKINLETRPKIIFLSNSINPIDKKSAEENSAVLELINKPLTLDYLKNLNTRFNDAN